MTNSNHRAYPLTPILIVIDLLVVYYSADLASELLPNINFIGMATVLAIFMAPLVALSFGMFGVYASWRVNGMHYFFRHVFTAVWAAFAVASIAMIFLNKVILVDRYWFALWFTLLNTFAFSYRCIAGIILNWLRVHGVNNKRVVLIGTNDQLQNIQTHFWQNPKFGIDVVYSVAVDEPEQGWCLSEFDANHLHNEYAPDDIWICLPLTEAHRIKNIQYQLRNSLASIRFIPHAGDLMLLNHRMTSVMGYNSIELNYSPLCGVNHYVKLVTDFVFAFFILLIIAPVMAVIAVGVKLSSSGPVLFKQRRLGINGKPVFVYKFRSMKLHAEGEGKVTQATKNDSRVTRFGAFLRSSSLDELPQFFNVLQGRMSIVGPRPHALAHNDYYKNLVDSYMLRHRVKPGITGWAQVNGLRGETDTLEKMEKRVQHDLWYIENWSLWLDIRIIIATAFKGFFNPNAY